MPHQSTPWNNQKRVIIFPKENHFLLTIARLRSFSVVVSDTIASIIAILALESPLTIRANIKIVKLYETHQMAYEKEMPI